MPRHAFGPAPALLALLAVPLLGACGAGAEEAAAPAGATTAPVSSPATTPAPTTSSTPGSTSPPAGTPAAAGVTVRTGPSAFGSVLFGRAGQAVYLFDKERSSRPRCYGGCADAWPPVLTDGDPRAAGRVRGDLLGTTERRDGSVQVTYDGRPLYYYAHEGPDEVTCHDVVEFGGRWLAVVPAGGAAG